MDLAQLLRANPLRAFALLICLATILWCILLTRRQRNGLDKILTGLLGLIAVYHALRILKDSGFTPFAHFRTMQAWVDVISACLYLVAASMLKTSGSDRWVTRVHLRLAQAEEKPLDLPGAVIAGLTELSDPLLDSCPLAIVAIDVYGKVTHCNTAAEGLTGWTRYELVGHELPFDPHGPLQAKNGNSIDAAVWTSTIRSSFGSARGTLIMAAGKAALQDAGVELPAEAKTYFAVQT